MKKFTEVLVIIALVLAGFTWPFFADAQVIPSIPYNLTNGSVADATQVMGNFNTIVTDVNANAATGGVNTNITSLTGLTTPLAATYGGTVVYTGGTTGGSANAQTLATTVPSNFALTAGNIVTGLAGFTNTGATTLSVNSGAATAVRKQTPSGLTALTGGEIVLGQALLFYYDGTYFELVNNTSGITNAQLAPMANLTVKGNISGGSATPSDLTSANVAELISAVVRVQRQTVTATGSSTYTPCAGLIYGDYELWGGGGGGGGVNTTAGAAAAGGGAAGYSRKIINGATIGASQTVVIGAGGTSGSNSGGNGGAGGTSTFASVLSVTGGGGGTGSTNADTEVAPGAGGAGSGGDINKTGAYGLYANDANLQATDAGGSGGSTSLGGNGLGGFSGAAGGNAIANSGSGGGGAASGTGTAEAGGSGGTGYFVATEYCNQ